MVINVPDSFGMILGFSIKDGANPLASLAPCKQKNTKLRKMLKKLPKKKCGSKSISLGHGLKCIADRYDQNQSS